MGLLDNIMKRRRAKCEMRAERSAEDTFQICEHEGKVWLLCYDTLVCPVEMFGADDGIDALLRIRKLHIDMYKKKFSLFGF